MRSKAGTISSKGQITVPLDVRRRLGLRPGDRVEFVADAGRTVLCPARGEQNPFLKYAGALPSFGNRREIKAWIGSLRDEPGRERRGR